MRVMAQLSEMGLGLARALTAQVCDGGPEVMRGDVGLLFSRISRAIRQCIALEAKIAVALREWRGLSEAERAERRAAIVAAANTASGAIAAKAPADAAPEIEDVKEIDHESDGLRGETERGERPERFWADSYVIEDETSFAGIVAKACRDLGVTPDWSQWSEDGPGDLVVKTDDDNGFWLGAALDLATRPGPVRRGASQRGPPD